MKRILVAAGDKTLSRFVAESLLGRKINRTNPSLTSAQWDVSRAHTALEIELLVTRSGREFDVLVIDQNLPGQDLLTTLSVLRRTPQTADAPIFVMSERGRDQLTRQLASERYFVAGFIDKPVTTETLRTGLSNLERQRLIFVVDSDRDRAQISAEALRESGYEVRLCASGRAAIDAAREQRPDGVVCALSLNDMAGSDVCIQLKRQRETHNLPVLVHGEIADLARIEISENAHRADDFLREPFTGEMLVERVVPLAGRGSTRPSEGPEAATLAPPPIPARSMATAPPVPVEGSITARGGPPNDWSRRRRDTETNLHAMPYDAGDTIIDGDAVDPPTLRDQFVNMPPPSASPSVAATKRATRRVPCRVEVKIKDGETIYESETLNISNGGIMITTDHPLKVGTQIDLTFQLPESAKDIHAAGKVAWLSRAPEAAEGWRTLAAGVKFTDIEPNHLKLIVDYVNRVANVVYVAP